MLSRFTTPSALTLLATALLTVTLPSQSPTGDACIDTFVTDRTGVRGGGDTYRVQFDEHGVCFTPALGRAAPATRTWSFALDSVRRGERVLLGAPDTNGPPQRTGARVTYHRGAGVHEVYDVLGKGVEQSFVFDAVPGGGDLVVRGRVTSDLAARPVVGAGRIDFVAGELGGVFVADVLCLDAAGRRTAGSMTWDGEFLDLVVPAAFVEGADMPLVLDPLIGTVRTIGSTANDHAEPDSAWLESEAAYLVVCERAFSATDVEIRATLRDEGNTPIQGWTTISSGGVNTDPSVGALLGRGRFVVAWQSAPSLLGPYDIVACTVDGTGSVGAAVTVTQTGGVATTTSERHPDVAGKPANFNGTFVVFEVAGVGIDSRVLAVDGNGAITLGAQSSIATNTTATRPRVSNGSAAQHVVVWQVRYDFTGGSTDALRICRLDAQGAPDATISSLQGTGRNYRTPDVDGGPLGYKVVATAEDAANPGFSWIVTSDVTFNGTTTVTSFTDWITSASRRDARIAWVGPKYLTTWTQEVGFLDYEVHGRAIATDPGALTFAGDEFTVGGLNGIDVRPAIGSQRGGSGGAADRQDALLVWSSIDTATFFSNVNGQIYRSMLGGPIQTMTQGCGSNVALGENGPFAVGNLQFAFEMTTDNPTPILGAFNYGFGNYVPCGSCVAVSPFAIDLAVFPAPTATISRQLAIPNTPTLVGYLLDVQGMVWGAPTNACPLLAEFSFSPVQRYRLEY